MRRFATLLPVALLPAAAAAQVWGTVAGGAGTVRFGGGTAAGLATLTPSLTWIAPDLTGWVSGTAALLPGGDWAWLGSASVAAVSRPLAAHWRVGGEVTAGGTSVSGGDRTASLGALGEVSWRGAGWGIAGAAGTTGGWLVGAPGAASLRTRVHAWWQSPLVRLDAQAEPTRFLGAWFTDFTTSAAFHAGPVDVTLTALARASRGWGSAAAANVVMDVAFSPSVGFQMAGGSVLADPYQGFPRAGFLSASVKLFLPPRPSPERLRKATSAIAHPDAGGLVQVTFRLAGDSARIAGDWNAWTPEPLEAVSPGVWRFAKALAPGTYRFSLVTGDGRWVLPAGFAQVPDDFGGMAAVLVVE